MKNKTQLTEKNESGLVNVILYAAVSFITVVAFLFASLIALFIFGS